MDEKQKPVTFRRTVEQVIEFPERTVNLENLSIAGADYSLKITNKDGRLFLSFNEGDYDIIIDKDGIRFKRIVYRPSHDHNDEESFQVGVDENVLGVKKGELKWLSRFPYNCEGRDFFKIDFGAKTVDY